MSMMLIRSTNPNFRAELLVYLIATAVANMLDGKIGILGACMLTEPVTNTLIVIETKLRLD